MTDRELLELIASQVGNLTTQVDSLTTQVDSLTTQVVSLSRDMVEVKADLGSVKAIVLNIEHDHGQKLGVLFDGYILNSEKLDRIEAEVIKHEEIILKRIS